jgi:hypothetical protein
MTVVMVYGFEIRIVVMGEGGLFTLVLEYD